MQDFTLKMLVLHDKLAGEIGVSNGMNINLAVAQVFINYLILGMDLSDAVQAPSKTYK